MSGVTLVTGGSGFVGKELVRLLRAQGEQVRSFDLAQPLCADDVQGSITDEQAVAAAMEGVRSVFHLAGNAQLWSKDENQFDEVNRRGTEIVVAAATKAGVSKFVHCSSLTTLIGKNTPVGPSIADESLRLFSNEMLGPYPRSKLAAEHIVEGAAADGLDAIIALPTEPLGPGDAALTPPTKMILDFANGATPAYIDCILNFVPAASIAEGLIAARKEGARGARYLLGGENTPMVTLLAEIEKITGVAAPKTRMPYWVALAAGAVDTGLVSAITGKPPKAPLTGVRLAGRQVSFSSEKAARELGWRAADWRPALRTAIGWFDEQGLLLKPVS